MKILETDRLILRTWQAEDIAPMAAINQDPKVMAHFPALLDLARTKLLIKKFIEHFNEHRYTLYAVDLKKDHTFIGFVGLSSTRFEAHFTPAIEIGWRIASKHWGKGYATEAAQAVLHLAFTELNLDEVVSFTVVNNTKSRRVMDKIGLCRSKTDDFDHPNIHEDSPLRQHVLYRLTKDEYLAYLLSN